MYIRSPEGGILLWLQNLLRAAGRLLYSSERAANGPLSYDQVQTDLQEDGEGGDPVGREDLLESAPHPQQQIDSPFYMLYVVAT